MSDSPRSPSRLGRNFESDFFKKASQGRSLKREILARMIGEALEK